MVVRRIIPTVSVLALSLAACSSAGTAIGSSSGHRVALPATASQSRTVVLDPSTGKVVVPSAQGSVHDIILNPSTGQIVWVSH